MKYSNVYTANQDIREYMADHGVGQRELAEQMGMTVYRINTMLKTELTNEKKEVILQNIDAIANKGIEETEEVAEETVEVEEVEQTNGPKFQIGDRVKVPSKTLCIGIVADIWHSLIQDKLMYAVDIEGGSRSLYLENQLEPAPLPTTYSFDAHIDGNVAVVTMIATQGEKQWVYARGHAHIIHDGEVGMAQAISYAARRMFESLDSQQENKIYVKGESK